MTLPQNPQWFRYFPYAFTEFGVAMLSSVLKSERAIAVNIQIMRTFTCLRETLLDNDQLRLKVEAMEKQYDENFKVVFDAIRRLLDDGESHQEQIGFKTPQNQKPPPSSDSRVELMKAAGRVSLRWWLGKPILDRGEIHVEPESYFLE